MQLSSEQTTDKLVELVVPNVFIYNVKSDKHRDAIRLQNVWESISMAMGVDGMDGKCWCNHARVKVKEFKPNQGQWKTFILGLGIDPKKKYHSIQLQFYFSVLRWKQKKIYKFITESFKNNNIFLIIPQIRLPQFFCLINCNSYRMPSTPSCDCRLKLMMWLFDWDVISYILTIK